MKNKNKRIRKEKGRCIFILVDSFHLSIREGPADPWKRGWIFSHEILDPPYFHSILRKKNRKVAIIWLCIAKIVYSGVISSALKGLNVT